MDHPLDCPVRNALHSCQAGERISVAAGRIVARDEMPLLHTYPDTDGAIALYQSLGLRPRAEINYVIFERG